ncbi:biotin synthase BioB [Alkalihalobacillus hemicellulosilyticus]|uniref:Biotin synthase n=1 Tax=Halalkalibacter hemicellulosilyticusJCM 9152 TaxID=1236971 RepID=W4QEB6_9BACI|nr:biotin synthase BioB [Halalkalibacter hemicellulosilyticus]GAE29704.1 biotin synthase [Halalkalibacter hemicellulosilyticusJCM 9152]
MRWSQISEKIINGYLLTKEEALSVLRTSDTEVIALVHEAYRIRHYYYGKKVKLNMILNAKSGLCPEDCGYCSQSFKATSDCDTYALVDEETIVEGAKTAARGKIGTYCIVMSGRRPTNREVDRISGAVEEIKREHPHLKICACLGLATEDQTIKLKQSGVDRYNHNINTSERYHSEVVTTHTYDQRVETLETMKKHGISPCSGVICGMGETDEDIVDMAFALRELDADSIPVNFLHAIEGTKFANKDELTPMQCLKILALFRFINPTKEIRISGGREVNLRSLQSMGLFIANSIFVGDYLTTQGQPNLADYDMVRDLGFEIEENAFERDTSVVEAKL